MNSSYFCKFLVLFIVGSLFLVGSIHFGVAQGVSYKTSQEWVLVKINSDASVNVEYNLTVVYLTGQPQGIVTVGMPQSGFQIQNVQDISGSSLQYLDVSSGNYYGIEVDLKGPIILNQPYTFTVNSIVPQMIFLDKSNPGNVELQFNPTTFATATNSISDLRVAITLPPGVQANQTKYSTGFPFDSEFIQGNSLVVFWERTNWPQDQTFQSGVSFPQEFVSPLPTSSPTLTASLSESASALYYGKAVNFTVLADGGTKPYTFSWYIDSQMAQTSASQYFSTDFQAVASHHVYVQVTDADNNSANTLTVEFNILPASSNSPGISPGLSSSPIQQPTSTQTAEPFPTTLVMTVVIVVVIATIVLVVLIIVGLTRYIVKSKKRALS